MNIENIKNTKNIKKASLKTRIIPWIPVIGIFIVLFGNHEGKELWSGIPMVIMSAFVQGMCLILTLALLAY